MAQSFLIFDFGADEAAAQQARHRIEGWKQAFRLDKKILLKFDRKEEDVRQDSAPEPAPKTANRNPKAKASSKAGSKAVAEAEEKGSEEPTVSADISLLVRLDFSDHEKLSHHRWLDRIPTEEPFKAVKAKIVRSGDPDHSATAKRFDALD
jgi:hypothetical protein